MGHIILEINCSMGVDSNSIEVNYLITDSLSPYKVILRRPLIKFLGEIISTKYLVLKYPPSSEKFGMII